MNHDEKMRVALRAEAQAERILRWSLSTPEPIMTLAEIKRAQANAPRDFAAAAREIHALHDRVAQRLGWPHDFE